MVNCPPLNISLKSDPLSKVGRVRRTAGHDERLTANPRTAVCVRGWRTRILYVHYIIGFCCSSSLAETSYDPRVDIPHLIASFHSSSRPARLLAHFLCRVVPEVPAVSFLRVSSIIFFAPETPPVVDRSLRTSPLNFYLRRPRTTKS